MTSPPLHVSTTAFEDTSTESGADSPRTKVAEKLQQLEIRTAAQSESDPIVAPRKRLKRADEIPVEEALSAHEDMLATPVQPSGLPEHAGHALEIGETPECRTRMPSSPPQSPFPAGWRKVAINPFPKEPAQSLRPARLPSPPPPTPVTSPTHMTDTSLKRPMSPLELDHEIDVSPKALVWQESEITGHDIDFTTPDDDGEGINGIGFRPTPAMAYARSQKRKQQVSEWRAREARDARQRRIERRRGASGETSSDAEARRMVRFAEVG